MQNTHPSLARRALLAVALFAGFYVLGLVIAFGFSWLALRRVAVCRSRHPAPAGLRGWWEPASFCGPSSHALIALRPRARSLRRAVSPVFFQLIREVASATGQELPRQVYLVPAVNAWVAQRGASWDSGVGGSWGWGFRC